MVISWDVITKKTCPTVNKQKMIISKKDYEELKKAYTEAVSTKKNSFTLSKTEVITDFAKYYLEFLELPENKKHIK